jgi:hypothetical protein
MSEMDLLQELIVVSEKAANVARLCRQNDHLFQLLIQKKRPDEANPRFVDDFKTSGRRPHPATGQARRRQPSKNDSVKFC